MTEIEKWQDLIKDEAAMALYKLKAPLHEVIRFNTWYDNEQRSGRTSEWFSCSTHGEKMVLVKEDETPSCTICDTLMKKLPPKPRDTSWQLPVDVPKYYDQAGKPVMSGGTTKVSAKVLAEQARQGR